ncbi:MAG: exosome complex protein Rrp4 [Candidatus Undinarchaeales archaeon]|jgi:exosome complex component RRP4|nr:exosome complex protein Rrp4 [Candidatus Undinarchaeales archaeon]MDP7492683.1 exosome complex protein Rrp4 [Candidatus Undinarchaeales archaeon]
MARILVKPRQLVVPGTPLASGVVGGAAPGTRLDGDTLYATVVGLASVRSGDVGIIPLGGPYLPSKGDIVIGIVTAVRGTWIEIDIKAPWSADLGLEGGDDRRPERGWRKGDAVLATVTGMDEEKHAMLDISGMDHGPISEGLLIDVPAPKVARLIGRSGSMVGMIRELTGCTIIVGLNGRVMIQGTPGGQLLAARAVGLVEANAHTHGLTDAVRVFLEGERRD